VQRSLKSLKRGTKVKETNGTPRSLLQLINGKVDFYINDAASIQWELKKLIKEGRYMTEVI
jgi:polar amino acid transport system substrate-binding protein